MRTPEKHLSLYVQQLAHVASSQRPSSIGLEIAATHLTTASRLLAEGETHRVCVSLALASEAFVGALDDLWTRHALEQELDRVLGHTQTVYLDTNIVSEGLDKKRLTAVELEALDRILRAAQLHAIELRASRVMEEELNMIPQEYRERQLTLYLLLRWADGIPSDGDHPNQEKLERIRCSLSPKDYEHVKEALLAHCEVFLTVDTGILANKAVIEQIGMLVLRPLELLEYLNAHHLDWE